MKDFFLAHGMVVDVCRGIFSERTLGYRSKITPHFYRPREGAIAAIGFDTMNGPNRLLDVEECPIAMATLNAALPAVRAATRGNASSYKRGATLLLRASVSSCQAARPAVPTVMGGLAPAHPSALSESPSPPAPLLADDAVSQGEMPLVEHENLAPTWVPELAATYSTVVGHSNLAVERVGAFEFEYVAGEFFQTNPFVLPLLVEHVLDQAQSPVPPPAGPCTSLPPPAPATSLPPNPSACAGNSISTLVDTYCGAGLFSVCGSRRFEHCIGVEVSHRSVAAAVRNAQRNGAANCTFQCASV